MEFFHGNVVTLQSVTSGGFLRTHADRSIDARARESDAQCRWTVAAASSSSSDRFLLRSTWKPSLCLKISKLSGKGTGVPPSSTASNKNAKAEFLIQAEPFQMNTFKLSGKFGTLAFDEHGHVCSAADVAATKLIVKIVDGLFAPGNVISICNLGTGKYLNIIPRSKGKGLDPNSLDIISANGSASDPGSKFVVLSEGVCQTLGRQDGCGFIRLQAAEDRTKFLALNKDQSLSVKPASSSDTHFYIWPVNKGEFCLEQAHANGFVGFNKDGMPVRGNIAGPTQKGSQFTVLASSSSAPVPGRPDDFHFARMVVTLSNPAKKELWAWTMRDVLAETHGSYSKSTDAPQVSVVTDGISPNVAVFDILSSNSAFPKFANDVMKSAALSAIRIKAQSDPAFSFGKRSIEFLVLGKINEAAKAVYEKFKTSLPGASVTIKYDDIHAGWIQKPRARNFAARFGSDFVAGAGLNQFRSSEAADEFVAFNKSFAASSSFPEAPSWFYYRINPGMVLHYVMATTKQFDQISTYTGGDKTASRITATVINGSYDFTGAISEGLKSTLGAWEDAPEYNLKMCYPNHYGGWIGCSKLPGAPKEYTFTEILFKFSSNADVQEMAESYKSLSLAKNPKHFLIYEKNPLTLSVTWVNMNRDNEAQNKLNQASAAQSVDPPHWATVFPRAKSIEVQVFGNPSTAIKEYYKWWQGNAPNLSFVRYVTPMAGWTYGGDQQGETKYIYCRTEMCFENFADMSKFVGIMAGKLELGTFRQNEVTFIQRVTDSKVAIFQVFDNDDFVNYIKKIFDSNDLVECLKSATSTAIETVGDIDDNSRATLNYLEGDATSHMANYFDYKEDTSALNISVSYPEQLGGYAHLTLRK